MKQVEDKANQSGASDRMSSVNELRQAEQRLSMEEEARKESHFPSVYDINYVNLLSYVILWCHVKISTIACMNVSS